MIYIQSAAENHEINRLGNMSKFSINEHNEKIFSNCQMQKTYLIVNKQVKFLTAFSSSQMNRAKFAYAMSWRGNVSNSTYRQHLQKCLYKGLCPKLSTNYKKQFYVTHW